MSSYSKGYKVEMEWKLILEDRGHIVTRISGSGCPENPYDLHSTNNSGKSYLWEIKSTSGLVKYFSMNEFERIKELGNLSRNHRIQPLVAVKFKKKKRGLKFVVVTPYFVIKNRRVRFNDKSLWIP